MEIVASCAGVDPDDIQAQVDVMYEHILSSVDVSMNKSFESTFAGKSERRRGRGRMCPLESGGSGSASVKGKAAGEMCVCSCADDTLDVSDSTPSATLLSDGSRACSCCCHRDSHGGSRQRGRYGRCVKGVDTSKRNGMDASLSLMSTERIAGHGDSDRLLNRSKFGLLPLRRQQPPPSTFGSGRKGMSDPIKKTADPGPGSYFAVEDEKVLPLSNVRSYSNGNNVSRSRHVNIKSVKSPTVAAASSSTFAAGGIERNAHDTTAGSCRKAEKAVKALRRQFELFCDCYWKQFPDLEMPINAAAHATKCPCQSIRAASLGTSDVESRSTSGGGSCGGGSSGRGRVNKKRQQQQRRQKLIIPATSTIAAVSPRREGTLSRKRGAIFGTSPRRTIFSDEPQRGVMAAEKKESGRGREAKKRNSSMRDKTPTRRQAMDEATVPSPGACNVASAFDAVSARGKVRSMSIGRAERQMHASTFAPGPGAHGIEPKGGGGGITGGSAGAAAATRKCFLTSSPRRLELVENKEGRSGPGPGEYSTEKSARSDARHKNAPAFSFGRAKLPGCVKTLFNASTMEKSDESPGPGTYDISTTLPDGGATIGGRSAVITTARRSDNICHGMHCPSDDTPGPGTYTVTDKEKGPSYSLRPRLSERIEVTPGPGHYVLPEKTTGPQWTFSARWRPSVVEEFGPGPGDYFVPIFDLRREHSTAPFFPTAPRRLHEEVSKAATIPGPGAYDMTAGIIDATTRSAVIGTAHRLPAFESSKDDVPGPASYSVRHSSHERHVPVPLLSSTAPRFGDTHENNNHNIMGPTPGPGYYDIDGHMNMVNQRGVVIGTAPRPSIIDETVSAAGVGPGSYYVNQPNDGPSFSMGQRWTKRMTADEEETPGPGMYEPNKLTEGPSAIVSGAPRFKSNDEEKARLNIPGPGAYEAVLPTTKSMTAFFGTSPRMLSKEDDNNNNENNGLGPGVYDPQEIKRGIAGAAWGTGHRFVVEGQKEEIPGPGWYLPQYVHERHAPAAVFGSSPKHVLAAEEREAFMNKNIGPGSYEVTWQNPHTFHATFGKAETRRIELEGETEKTPGPGHYMIADAPASPSRAVVFGAASRMPLTQQERDKTPGPGAYSPTLQSGGDASPSGPVSFPTAPRFNAAAAADDAAGGYYNAHDGTPGPGAYAVDSEGRYGRAAAVVFGTESRIPNHEEREQALFPGPGQYEITNKWTGMNAPAYTFGKNSRMVGNEGDSIAGGGGGTGKEGGIPGPGAYDVVIPTFTAPTTRFGTAGRTVGPLILAEAPGPGTYDVTTGASMTASAPPAYRFSTAPRELHDAVEDTPGPGQYDGTSTNENLQRRFAATAGPSFTTEPRFSAEKDNNDALPPGPGQYSPHHPQWDATQVYSFPSGRKDLLSGNHYAAAEIPGPGTYDISLTRDPGPTFSMYRTAPRGPTLVELEKSQIPGPGAYTIPPAFPVTEGAGAAISFVRAERFKNPGDDTNDHRAAGGSCSVVPGPGYYDPHLPQSTPGPVIGRAPRLAEVDGMVTSGGATVPGPGHYEVTRGDSVLSTTIDGGVAMRFTAPRFSTIDEANASEIPGPTSYCPVIPENFASGGISFPHAQRFALAGDSNESAGHPGPGEYSIPSTWHHSAEQAAGYSFGTSRRMEPGDTRQDIPGPGSYDTSQYEKLYMTGPAFSLQGKPSFVQEQAAGAENPGPGAYSLQYMETIGTTARATKFAPLPTVDPDAVFEARINATPGPTTYFIPATLSQQAASFGTAPRTKEETDDHLPGPGAYLTSGPIVVMNQPAFTIGNALRPEIAPHGQSDFPGPGEYHHAMDPRPSVPTFTFAGAERFAEVDAVSNLGPGQYYHPGSADASRGHSFSFPTNPTAATGASATSGSGFLGPGEYFRPVPLGMAERGPTFPTTLGHYPPTLGADTPGPGAYHMEPSVHNTSAAAAARMAAQQRESKTK